MAVKPNVGSQCKFDLENNIRDNLHQELGVCMSRVYGVVEVYINGEKWTIYK